MYSLRFKPPVWMLFSIFCFILTGPLDAVLVEHPALFILFLLMTTLFLLHSITSVWYSFHLIPRRKTDFSLGSKFFIFSFLFSSLVSLVLIWRGNGTAARTLYLYSFS